MARQFTIEVGGESYTGHTAPAKDQIEMLHISAKTNILTSMQDGVSDRMIVANMTFASREDVERLAKLCINGGNIVRDEDSVPVAENLFQDEVCNYYLLLSKAIKENVGNFWKLNAGEEKETPIQE